MGTLTFVETRLFTSLVGGYLSDDEYAALQLSIAENPEAGQMSAGPVVSGSEVWMLTVYAKNEADSIPGHLLKRITEEIDASS